MGLCNKKMMKNTKLIIFFLKIYPFVKLDNKKNFFEQIKNFFSKADKKYNKLLDYFEKNWLNHRFVNFDCMNQGEYLFRTNNYIESFHKNLNDSLNSFHPKISYLVEKLKNFTINGYQIYIESIVNNKEEKYIKYSVIVDILLFISKFKKNIKLI